MLKNFVYAVQIAQVSRTTNESCVTSRFRAQFVSKIHSLNGIVADRSRIEQSRRKILSQTRTRIKNKIGLEFTKLSGGLTK